LKLAVRISYWTDFVGTFDPGKVVGLVKRAFPETVVDPIDYQAARLDRELEHFAKIPEPQRTTMIRQARRNAQDNGPTFRFEIPTAVGPVKGQARRYSVTFDLPDGVSDDLRSRLESLLKGLQLGEPKCGP
jgi:hypothetical protein